MLNPGAFFTRVRADPTRFADELVLEFYFSVQLSGQVAINIETFKLRTSEHKIT